MSNLILNDTFDNFSFSSSGKIIQNKKPTAFDVKFEEKFSTKVPFQSGNEESHISFDDSIFLSESGSFISFTKTSISIDDTENKTNSNEIYNNTINGESTITKPHIHSLVARELDNTSNKSFSKEEIVVSKNSSAQINDHSYLHNGLSNGNEENITTTKLNNSLNDRTQCGFLRKSPRINQITKAGIITNVNLNRANGTVVNPKQITSELSHCKTMIDKHKHNGIKKSNANESLAAESQFPLEAHINSLSDENAKMSSWGLPDIILEKYKNRNITHMFSWQVECLSRPSILDQNKNLVYSAPTSAGKTLVAEILAIKTILERQKKVLFILPFVSVVREKMFYFQDILGTSGIRVEGFMGSYNPPGGFRKIQVAICTIEKANSLINRLLEENKLHEIGAIIVDEIHLLGDPSRGYLLELLLTKLRYMSLKSDKIRIQIIGMSATLPNLPLLAKWLNAELFTTSFRPIPLYERCQVNGEIYNNALVLERKLIPIPALDVDTDNVLQLCLETIITSCSVLIFCPTKNWCENLAQQIAVSFWKLGCSKTPLGNKLRSELNPQLIQECLEQLKGCPVGLDQILGKTVSFGAAFHHAGLTMDERDIIEGGFRNGCIRVLVATSTLSSGVNLPARRVIIRTPMFHGKPIDTLTYRQMIGRAGRMGKDTAGESILICQKNDYKIAKQLMSAKLQPIESCLEGAGKLKRAILEVIASEVASSPEDIDLFTRCTLLSCDDAQEREISNPIEDALGFLINNEFIRLQIVEGNSSKYVATSLAKACLSSSLPPEEGLALFTELERARQCFVLETDLHLIYLVTPYSVCNQLGNIDWMQYLEMWEKLSASMKRVGELVGIKVSYIINGTRGKIQTNTSKLFHKLQVHKRFYTALALQDLVNEVPLNDVAVKFGCNRGMLQSLQQSAATFAGMVTSFSKQLGWTTVELIISQFQGRLQFGVSKDLLDLMRLPLLNGQRARALFVAGIETLVDLANTDVYTLENVLHKAKPFESEKERDGESEYDVAQRNKLRTIWVSGKQGMTEKEAAQMLIEDSRTYLQLELGLCEVKWEEKQKSEGIKFVDKSTTDCESVDESTTDNKTVDESTSDNKTVEESKLVAKLIYHSKINTKSVENTNRETVGGSKTKLKIVNDLKIAKKTVEGSKSKLITVDDVKITKKTVEQSKINGDTIEELRINRKPGEELVININLVEQQNIHGQSIMESNMDKTSVMESKFNQQIIQESNIALYNTSTLCKSYQSTSSLSNNRHNTINMGISEDIKIKGNSEGTEREIVSKECQTFSLNKANEQPKKQQMRRTDVKTKSTKVSPKRLSDSSNPSYNLRSRRSNEAILSHSLEFSESLSTSTNTNLNENIGTLCNSSKLDGSKSYASDQSLFGDSFSLDSKLLQNLSEIEKKTELNNTNGSNANILESLGVADAFNTTFEFSSNSSNRADTLQKLEGCNLETQFSKNDDIVNASCKTSDELSADISRKRNRVSIGGDSVIHSPIKKYKSSKSRSQRASSLNVDSTYTMPSKRSVQTDNEDFLDLIKIEIINVCDNKMLFDRFSKELLQQNQIALAIGCELIAEDKPTIGSNIIKKERSSLPPSDDLKFKETRICGVSITWGENTVHHINLKTGKTITNNAIINLLQTTLSNDNLSVKIFDSKEQIKLLKKICDIDFNCQCEDPKVGDWLLDPEGREKNLLAMTAMYLPEATNLCEMAGVSKGFGSISLNIHTALDARLRSSVECLVCWHLMDALKSRLYEQSNLLHTFGIEMNCIIILSKMEIAGIGINLKELERLADELKYYISKIESQAFQMAGHHFSFVSPKEVARVLGFGRAKRVSTNKQVLQQCEHPISNLIIMWRKLNSMLTNMVYPLLRLVEKGRIYGTSITHNSTGRISMHEPNLQNVPKDFKFVNPATDECINICCRKSFTALDKNVFISADYCQLELRLLAHLSKDSTLCTIMKSNSDIFLLVAAKWNNIAEEQVTELHRAQTKQICYGIIYGMGIKTLAEQLNTTEQEALEFTAKFHRKYPALQQFMNETITKCRESGYVETIAGRRRYLPHINAPNSAIKGHAERQAVNTTVQGSAADIVKNAMVLLENKIKEKFRSSRNKPKLVLHLHDELLYEVADKYLHIFSKLLKKCMQDSVKLSIPFPVKVKSGRSWGELKEIIV